MTNLEMLLNEFCGMQELSRYMDANFPDGWDDYDLAEECENNVEYILQFLGISTWSWDDAWAELEDDDPDRDSYNPNDDYLLVGEVY